MVWSNDIESYLSAFQRTVEDFTELGVHVRFRLLEIDQHNHFCESLWMIFDCVLQLKFFKKKSVFYLNYSFNKPAETCQIDSLCCINNATSYG